MKVDRLYVFFGISCQAIRIMLTGY